MKSPGRSTPQGVAFAGILREGGELVKKQFLPFLAALMAFSISIILVPFVGHNSQGLVGYLLFLIFFIELPIVVVMSRDVLFELNTSSSGSIIFRLLIRAIASLPSFIFGATSICIGIVIIGWVMYNVFIERLPEYTGYALLPSLGIGPVLVYWGYSNIKSILGMEEKLKEHQPERVVFDDTEIIRYCGDVIVERIDWAEVAEISVLTTDDGPCAEDAFIVFCNPETGQGCLVPNGADGTDELVEKICGMPGFDEKTFIHAMGCTSNEQFLCWRKCDVP